MSTTASRHLHPPSHSLQGPLKSQVRTHGSRELWTLLTSGPGGDGLPGMGLVVSGVITIQIHPIVIRVDLGGTPGTLWSHLV